VPADAASADSSGRDLANNTTPFDGTSFDGVLRAPEIGGEIVVHAAMIFPL
jgi:hypothetical protein